MLLFLLCLWPSPTRAAAADDYLSDATGYIESVSYEEVSTGVVLFGLYNQLATIHVHQLLREERAKAEGNGDLKEFLSAKETFVSLLTKDGRLKTAHG